MKWSRIAAIVLCIISLGDVQAAAAQSPPASGPGRLEASIGALWIGPQALGSIDANATTSSGTGLKIFSAASDLGSVAGVDGRIAVRLMRAFEAEVEGSYGSPQLTVAISNDIEGAPSVTAIEQVQQFTIGGGVVWYVPLPPKPRFALFVTAGGGYLRQMHEARTLVVTGQYYQVGGGVKLLLVSRPRGFINAVGARIDLRAVIRMKGVAFDDGGHTAPAAGVSAFVRF
jgi:hypothetical protein